MITYTHGSMVKAEHIEEIDNQLQKLGSRVSEELVKGKSTHILANVLSLACGEGTYGISLDQINSIKHAEFVINCDCRHATIKKNAK